MKNADFWIAKLKLTEHPEGGYFSENYRSDEFIPEQALPPRFPGKRCFSTSIYFLLKGRQFSAFHRLKSDEIWYFHDGSPAVLHVISPDGGYCRLILGNDPDKGESLQLVIKRGHWFAVEVHDQDSYMLAGCGVSPGFDFEDFEMNTALEMAENFPEHSELILRFTKT